MSPPAGAGPARHSRGSSSSRPAAAAHPSDVKELRVALHRLDGAQGALKNDGVEQKAQDLAHLVRFKFQHRLESKYLAVGHPKDGGHPLDLSGTLAGVAVGRAENLVPRPRHCS